MSCSLIHEPPRRALLSNRDARRGPGARRRASHARRVPCLVVGCELPAHDVETPLAPAPADSLCTVHSTAVPACTCAVH